MKNIDEHTRTVVLSTLDDRSRQRITRIQKHLNVAGFRNVEIVRARTPATEEFDSKGLPHSLQGRWMTDLRHMWGSAACALSHLDFLATDQDELPIIVFEDDANISPNFFRYLAKIDCPDDLEWDICHLSYVNDSLNSRRNPSRVINEFLIHCAPNVAPGMYSYILTHPIYDKVVPLLEEIDCQLASMTESIRSLVIEHFPKLTSHDCELKSVRNDLDAIYWAQNNPMND